MVRSQARSQAEPYRMPGRRTLVPGWSRLVARSTVRPVQRKAQRRPAFGGNNGSVTGLAPDSDLSVTRQGHTFTWSALANRSLLPHDGPPAARRSLHVHDAFGQSGDYGPYRGRTRSGCATRDARHPRHAGHGRNTGNPWHPGNPGHEGHLWHPRHPRHASHPGYPGHDGHARARRLSRRHYAAGSPR